MTHSHRHAPSDPHAAPPVSRRGVRLLVTLLGVCLAAVVVGLVTLWPGKVTPAVERTTYAGEVTGSARECQAAGQCLVKVQVRLEEGPDTGRSTTLTFVEGATDPKLRTGETVLLVRDEQGGPQAAYVFADVERTTSMLVLAGIFVLAVLVVGRWKGLAAMVGLAIAGATLVGFVIPALVSGSPPALVALVGSALICLVALPISHGVSVSTGAAMVGTLCGLAIATLLAIVMLDALHFTGTSSDEAGYLGALGSQASFAGLLVCGAVIGALGVLNDVTVTQSVAVMEIAAADRTMPARRLFTSAMRIGRDHIASTVYSLVLAYAGSAVPLLLLFTLSDATVGEVLTSDLLGPELASGLIGSVALILVVPVTTGVAAVLARAGRPREHAVSPR